ncbi:MAG: Na+/H+ antiporter subunit C [Saprospirales bacterium]|nr:MAG: Na+/H+ antiporter subunit C [Saprospirales bacterium]
MITVLAFIVGLMYAAGIYLVLRRSLVKLIIGLIILGNGANLLIFILGGITKGHPPVIGSDELTLGEIYADPLPQALILTAIVIGFGLQAFAMVLLQREYVLGGVEDLDSLKDEDEDEL